ncbi:MAG TPA: ATP-binding protein [Acidimicrobiales bacterium]|jgi:PAS domain S-box-containing protein
MSRGASIERWPIAVGIGFGTLVLLLGTWALSPLLTAGLVVALLFAAACMLLVHRSDRGGGLAVEEIDRLRRAELALASAPNPEAAARELSKHAMVLLDAPAAVVLIEGLGDTVHMEAGDPVGHSIYDPGSRMRLLSNDGVPSGSIAVAARQGRDYDERDERVLDALADRVSSTLHRLSLFEAVQAEQRTLADVLGSSSDGIFSVGPDLNIRSWNPAMERITDIDRNDAIGHHCCATFRPLDENGAQLYGAACPGRNGEAVERMVQLPVGDDGGSRMLWLNCAFSPMTDGGYVVVSRDVTARKQIEDEKADFLATVSHELRTPLTPIKGFLQTLARRDKEFTQEERHHVYEVMLREELRLERLVHQLLQATSLEHADSSVVPETIDWEAAVREQVERMRREQPTREFSFDAVPHLPSVVADDQLTAQVLTNLLSNAVKFSPEGSPVGVSIALDDERIVTTISDRGPGVPTADRERIFDKFTRLGDHMTRPQQGVGLGLYIVRRSVEAMAGSVWVDDATGGGASFSFALPVAPTTSRRRRVRSP